MAYAIPATLIYFTPLFKVLIGLTTLSNKSIYFKTKKPNVLPFFAIDKLRKLPVKTFRTSILLPKTDSILNVWHQISIAATVGDDAYNK